MTLPQEYPKWLHASGRTSVIVNDADAEAAQLAEWGGGQPAPEPAGAEVAPAPATASSANNLGDWDGDGRPGGSVAPEKPENALTAPAEPKRGGWPKGKSRSGNRH